MMVKTVTSLKRDRLDATYYEVRLLELAEEDIRKLLMIFGQMIGEIRKRGENIE